MTYTRFGFSPVFPQFTTGVLMSPKFKPQSRKVEKRMPLSEPVASTPLARRMLDVLGPDDFSVLKTFQEQFGGKLVHYQDQAGQVGKKPGWVDG
jgi:hypothetical protein